MKPVREMYPEIFDDDPTSYEEYNQDYIQGIQHPNPFTSVGFVLPLILCFIPVVYHILFILDYDLLPLPELLWNILIYLTPSRLLDVVESYTNPLRISNPILRDIPRTHAAKSEAMRRALGLDKPGGIIGSVAQAGRRRLSTLQGMSIGAQGVDGRPAGLGNWDNSCYQNSVLQGLASLDSLSGYLTNPAIEKESTEGAEKPDMEMAEALRELIATLNDPSNNGRKIWTPAALKNMSSWQQQDAQEYFSKVLDEIDKEVGRVAKLMRSSQGFESDESAALSSTNPETLPMSTFRNPLEGLIAQRVGCTRCGFSEGLSMIPFNCLTVPLKANTWESDISECLDEYTTLEQIEGVECGKCTLLKNKRLLTTIMDRTKSSAADSPIYQQSKDRLEAVTAALEEDDYEERTLLHKCKIPSKNRVTSTKSRQAVIARPPKSLAVHFNRSLFDENTGELKKNTAMVRFPRILDLGPWCLGSSGTTEDASTEQWLLNPDQPMIAGSRRPSSLVGPMYELRAVVTHYGRHENGHYVCYRKHPNPEPEEGKEAEQKEVWWRLSDDDVMKVSEENVLGQSGVFMLFYDCIEPAATKSTHPVIPDIVRGATEANVQEAVAMEPGLVNVQPMSPELAVAASIPLPDTEDDDLSSSDGHESLLTTREESIATSISEYDEEETVDQDQSQDYQPAKAIVVPPYIKQTGVHDDDEGPEKPKIMSPGSLVMV